MLYNSRGRYNNISNLSTRLDFSITKRDMKTATHVSRLYIGAIVNFRRSMLIRIIIPTLAGTLTLPH